MPRAVCDYRTGCYLPYRKCCGRLKNNIQKNFNFFGENKLFPPENGFKSIRCQSFGNGYFFVLKPDETFVVQTVYLGKSDEVFTSSGHYHWNDDGRSIHLHGIENGPSYYFVGENQLIQLDMAGNRITGELAEKYVLKKVE
ncbi:MAG: copper resistance protein NlpE [Mariniphaga sp.]|nr:copper resistance protein NlpE [Mariniphaga sp.]